MLVGENGVGEAEGRLLDLIAVADTVRTGSAQAIKDLKAAGIEKVIMLASEIFWRARDNACQQITCHRLR